MGRLQTVNSGRLNALHWIGVVDRQYILDEITRTAAENRGVALGERRFSKSTGIRPSDWQQHWARWCDALKEAGLPANRFNSGLDKTALLEACTEVMRQLKKWPTTREYRIEARRRGLPVERTLSQRLGGWVQVRNQVRTYAEARAGYEDVVAWCGPPSRELQPVHSQEQTSTAGWEFVYLMRSGHGDYKIGRSNAAGRREYELGLILPTQPTLVHKIKTDDPAGIEAYWHQRFAARRKRGEWFALTAADVQAFRRRTLM